MTEDALLNKIHPDLISAKNLVYDACNFTFSHLIQEPESKEYGACTFTLNPSKIKFRAAKLTPTKTGLFVTLWKRNKAGITCPHEETDQIDYFVVSVRKNHQFGQFVFPKAELLKQHILASSQKAGKRGFRVYPPWEENLNKQALKTQQWQLNFFLKVSPDNTIDHDRCKLLYALK